MWPLGCSTLGPPDPSRGPVLVMAVNQPYVPLMVNLLCNRQAECFGDPHRDTLIIAQVPQPPFPFTCVSGLVEPAG